MKTKYLEYFLWLYIFISSIFVIYVYGFVVDTNGDNIEHLHTSWLIWQGKIPYKDFFQHHNPLLWYTFSPLVAVLINTYKITTIFNIISIITFFVIIYVITKILSLCNISKIAKLFLVSINISSYSLLWSTDYRPDTFMILSFFLGVYYLLFYNNKNDVYKLILSFVCFTLGFLFTQKILLMLAIPFVFVLYLLYQKKLSLNDLIISLVLPILCILFFISYLYINSTLLIYIKSNFIFNLHIPDIFYSQRYMFPPFEYYEFYLFIPLAVISSLWLFFKGENIPSKFLSMLFIFESILRIGYFSAFLHYNTFWLLTSIIIVIVFIDNLKINKILPIIFGVLYLLFSLAYIFKKTYIPEKIARKTQSGYQFAFEILTPCDYAINGYYATHNLRGKDGGYYGILLGQLDVLGEKLEIAPKDDINNIILKLKPKLISAEIYWDTYQEQRGNRVPAHIPSEYLINTYYQNAGVGKKMYILKPEYQKYNCQYNGESWEYVD